MTYSIIILKQLFCYTKNTDNLTYHCSSNKPAWFNRKIYFHVRDLLEEIRYLPIRHTRKYDACCVWLHATCYPLPNSNLNWNILIAYFLKRSQTFYAFFERVFLNGEAWNQMKDEISIFLLYRTVWKRFFCRERDCSVLKRKKLIVKLETVYFKCHWLDTLCMDQSFSKLCIFYEMIQIDFLTKVFWIEMLLWQRSVIG